MDQLLALAAGPSASLARVTLVAMEIVLRVDNLARHLPPADLAFIFPRATSTTRWLFPAQSRASTCSPDARANNRRNEMAEGGNPTLTDEGAAIAEILLPVAIDRPYSYLVP